MSDFANRYAVVPTRGSVWEQKARRVEVLHADACTVTYRVVREGSHRRTTEMDTLRFVALFREVPND